MSPLIRTVRDLRATMPGVVALILAVGATSALIALVIRGVQKDDLAEWGIVLGLFLQGIANLLTEASRHGNRVTDLAPTHVATTTTIEAEGAS